jgi:hypothetical protein
MASPAAVLEPAAQLALILYAIKLLGLAIRNSSFWTKAATTSSNGRRLLSVPNTRLPLVSVTTLIPLVVSALTSLRSCHPLAL